MFETFQVETSVGLSSNWILLSLSSRCLIKNERLYTEMEKLFQVKFQQRVKAYSLILLVGPGSDFWAGSGQACISRAVLADWRVSFVTCCSPEMKVLVGAAVLLREGWKEKMVVSWQQVEPHPGWRLQVGGWVGYRH